MTWSGSDADGTLLSEGAFGGVSIGVVQMEEVCGGLGSAGGVWCWLLAGAVDSDSDDGSSLANKAKRAPPIEFTIPPRNRRIHCRHSER